MLGFFVIKVDINDPENFKFVVKQENKLDIGNACLQVMQNRQRGFKELLISYKTIYINTYNVIIFDLSKSTKTQYYGTNEVNATLFCHESFQLWESSITGLLLEGQKDFLYANQSGAHIIGLGNNEMRDISDGYGNH